MSHFSKQLKTVKIGALDVLSLDMPEAVESLVSLALDRSYSGAKNVHFVNAYNISIASKNVEYKKILRESALIFPDGKSLEAYSLISPNKVRQIRGPSFFGKVLENGVSSNVRHFFLGSDPETLEKMQNQILHNYSNVNIVGSSSPPFREANDEERIKLDKMITLSKAHIVWVALGTPKQDYEAQRIAESTGIVSVAVGAAFDFMAKSKREAPKFLQNTGLEWAYRLFQEPKRLWRRYLFGNTIFLKVFIKDAIAAKKRDLRF
jgi:N-acetylglucosaminyldiphosphoundecaprenol N-acetyl-beta-D-mannosaminyltransferase